MSPFSEIYNYSLPEENIAQAPASPRDACKLLVYNTMTDEVHVDQFKNIDRYLPNDSFLVMNNTHVAPARLYCSNNTKAKIEVFILLNEVRPGDTLVRSMVDRTIAVGDILRVNGDTSQKHTFEVISQDRQYFMLRPSMPINELPALLEAFGTTPIPKYIKHTPLNETELRKKYQTVFAEPEEKKKPTHSVAAPTAALHFTKELLQKLAIKKVPQVMVTLHVGLGTFAPITDENLSVKKLFNEYYTVSTESAEYISRYKNEGRKLIAVGTTAVRTLESFARAKKNDSLQGTDIFIFPPFDFKYIDGLITNFHLPNSSLMMLVQALLEHKKARRTIRELYAFALENNFMFYSFGDAMLII